MRLVALALLVALPAYAADVPRAELVRDPLSGAVTHVLVPIDVATRNEAACAAAEAERDSLKASVRAAPSPVPVIVAVVVGVLAAGAAFAGGYAAGNASAAPK